MGWDEMLGEGCALSLTAAIFQGSQKFSESRDYEDSSIKYGVYIYIYLYIFKYGV